MTDEERELTPDSDNTPLGMDVNDTTSDVAEAVEEAVLADADDAAEVLEEEPVSDTEVDDFNIEALLPDTVTDGLDLEAALAAVSSLSDVVAEQEAAEQARLARIETEKQAKAERQARLENPELFFPVPPMTTLKRGQLASVVPALLLIGVGVWLTVVLTTTGSLPDSGLLAGLVIAGFGLTLVVRWLATGRWAGGSLFFGLALLLMGGSVIFLLQPFSPGLVSGWPMLIAAIGVALLLSGILTYPSDRRLVFPGVVILAVGLVGLIVTMNILSNEILVVAASLWPVAVVIVAIFFVLPMLFRQRQ
ncbi:MAG: hypothetical protein R3E39_14325 [Anaerolineae bacterium]